MNRNIDRANRRRQHLMIKRGRVGLKNRTQLLPQNAIEITATIAQKQELLLLFS